MFQVRWGLNGLPHLNLPFLLVPLFCLFQNSRFSGISNVLFLCWVGVLFLISAQNQDTNFH